jgi:type I restriction enzyme S subunit
MPHLRCCRTQLLHLQPEIAGKEGAVFASINKAEIEALPLALAPLSEQQRIVRVLDEAFAGLTTAQTHAAQNLKNARALFEGHLQSVFTHRGKGWVETTLGEVGKVSMCKRIFKEETTATEDIPFYKIGTFGKEPDAFIPIATYNEYRAKYSFPKKGDVLISASGTIGRRVRYDGEPAIVPDSNIVWIDNDEKQVLNDYLYHFCDACEWNSTKGATISRLNNDNLRQIVIAFPESHQEQRRIVTQLDALAAETQRLTRLYEQEQAALAALAALKKSLLHQAFAGAL